MERSGDAGRELPNKRRRSSSPSNVNRPSLSPSRPVLPPPTPTSHAPIGGGYPAFPPPPGVAGPSSWQSWERESTRDRGRDTIEHSRDRYVRRSMDARSPTSDITSPRMEGIDEGSESGVTFNRDTTSRAPRSMMACTRCRRQKMKCDGPAQVPCRGCRQAGAACIFEARSRPKSISTLPTRAPPFYPVSSGLSRPLETGTPGGTVFYPSGAQPAPPVTSRPHQDYALRSVREPAPSHAPQASIHSVTSAQPRGHSPTTSMSAMPQQYYLAPTPMAAPAQQPPSAYPTRATSPTFENRLRNIEGIVRPLSSLPSNFTSMQSQLSLIQRTTDATYANLQERVPTALSEARPREVAPDISDKLWRSYRASAWPLTPWLVGLREAKGLPGLVLAFLGSKPSVYQPDGTTKRDCDDAARAVHAEVGRLIANRGEWTREEIRSLGVFATWTGDHALAALAIGEARRQGIERILSSKRSLEDWREWIYLSLMDKLCHVVDFILPLSNERLSTAWRDRLNDATSSDQVVRDRDLKLLTWHEYAENLRAIYNSQQAARLELFETGAPHSTSPRSEIPPPLPESLPTAAEKAIEISKAWSSRWEAWAARWDVRGDGRGDPILSLHRNYASLYSLSPAFLCSSTVWADMTQTHDGSLQLERARDAAFAVIQAVCSGEVSRTLAFSFGLFRPLLGLSLLTLLSIATAGANSSSPVVSPSHLASVLRSTFETLVQAEPIDVTPAAIVGLPPPSSAERLARPSSRASRVSDVVPPSAGGADSSIGGSLLREIVAEGGLAKGKEVLGMEPSPETWRRLLG